MSKVLLRLVGAVAGLVMIAVAGGYLWLKSSAPALNGDVSVHGLAAETAIVRDEYGVPHIFAETVEDAYAALGFVHAQDRLVQMEFLRWVAQGRLAEKVGAGGIETDKLSRTLNLRRIGELSRAQADENTVKAFQKYADGVNAFIDSHTGAWPLEFVLLGETPEHWSAEDAFSLSGLILFSMPDWQDELVNARFANQLSPEQMADFFPPYPDDAPVTYSSSVAPQKEARKRETSTPGQHAGWPFVRGGFASNTWAVAGSRTKSGLPILASDPHGAFTAPIDYYLSRIEGPDFSFRGVGSPGFPAYILGHNKSIAWGLTDLGADITDLYLERTIDENLYEGPDGPAPFTIREEIIKVKGGNDIMLKVRETRHGPVISDVHRDAAAYAAAAGPNHLIALQMEASSAGVAFPSVMLQVNNARNWDEFLAALEGYDFQHNFSYADRDGNIGMVSAARLPEKNGDGMLTPREGWIAGNDWTRIKPVASVLYEKNPVQGFIANANNRLTQEGSSYEASTSPSPPYRITRIAELLSAGSDFDASSMKAVQNDVLSLAARQLLPLMTRIESRNENAQSAITMLRDWDGKMAPQRAEPLIYAAWLRELTRLVLADELGPLFDSWNEPREHSLALILDGRPQWCNDVTTPVNESCDEILNAALESALEQLKASYGDNMRKWRYGDAHDARFTHQIFNALPLLSSISQAHAPVGGDDRTINAAAVSYDEESLLQSTFGARYRQIIDLAAPENSQFMIAPGLSGNIFSPYYKNLVHKWAQGEYITLDGDQRAVGARGVGVINLKPE